MAFLADTMYNPRNWDGWDDLMPTFRLPDWRLPKIEMPGLPFNLPRLRISLPSLPLQSLTKIQNISRTLFLEFRDWIIAKDVHEKPSLGDRIIRWLKDVYHKLVFLFTGRPAPVETNWKQHALRLCTIAKRVAIVVGVSLAFAFIYRQTGESFKSLGESLVQQAATRGVVRGAVLETAGKGFIALGSVLCVASNVLQQTVLLPVYYIPKWTINAVYWACADFLKPVTSFVVKLLSETAIFSRDVISWTCTTVLGPGLRVTAEVVGEIFKGLIEFTGEAIPLAFDTICYVGSNFVTGTQWILRNTVVPLGVVGLKALGFCFDFTTSVLQILSGNN